MFQKSLFTSCFCGMLLSIGSIAVVSAQSDSEPQTAGEVFAGHLDGDEQKILDDNPLLAKAYEEWTAKIGQATNSYVEKLEKAFDREKTKGDVSFLKGLEKTQEAAKTQHKNPCILVDRLPAKFAEMQVEMNKAKSRANRAFVGVLDKATTETAKQKDLETAKTMEKLLFALFLPKSMTYQFDRVVRHENKIYLYNESKMNWAEAYAWSRERHGDLASIGNKETNDLLLWIMRKQSGGVVRQSWSGGIRIEKRWHWTDGTPFRYTNWVKGQPSGTSHEGILQDHISFGVKKEAGWDDNSNGFALPFMLQWTLY